MSSVFAQCLNEFQRYARAAQIDKRICVVRTLSADNAVCRRQVVFYIVVVSNDNLDTAVFEFLYRIDIGNAAVNCNDQIRLLLNDLVHDLFRKSVAMLGSVRHNVLHIRLMAPEISYENGCGSNAVTVVIAVNEHFATPVDRLIDDVDSLLHIVVQERIVPDSIFFRQELVLVLSLGDATVLEQNAKQRIGILDLTRSR